MDNLIKIEYRDKKSWVTFKDSLKVSWTDYSTKYKKERIKPSWILPEPITNAWNGAIHDVQQLRWDSYSFQFNIKESEVHDINKLQSCSDIKITEFSEDSTGSVKTKEYIVDTSLNSYFDIQAEPIEKSSAYKITVTFRTNKTWINKADSILNTNSIRFSATNWTAGIVNAFFTSDNYIASMSSTRLASFNNGYLRTYNLVNSVWNLTGYSINTGLTSEFAITGLDSTSIAVVGDNKLRKYIFDGAYWSLLGNSFDLTTTSTITSPSITKIDANTIAFMDDTDKLIKVFTFDGSDWAQLGNSFDLTTTSSLNAQISAHSADDIVYYDNYNKELRNYGWDGSDFTENHATVLTVNNFLLTAMDSVECALVDIDNLTLSKYSNSGSDYDLVGASYNLPDYSYFSITRLSDEEIVLCNADYTYEWAKTVETPTIYTPTFIDIAVLSATRIVMVQRAGGDASNDYMIAYDLVSGNWVKVGNIYTFADDGQFKSIDTINTNTISIRFGNQSFVRTYTFDGTDFAPVGNDYTLTTIIPKIKKLDVDTVVTYDAYDQYLRVLAWDGTDYSQTGNEFALSIPVASIFDISVISSSQIIFFDSYTKKLRVYDWDGTDFSLNFEQVMSVGVNVSIANMTSTSIALVDADNQVLTKYNIVGSAFVQDGDSISLGTASNWTATKLLTTNTVISYKVTGSYLTNFEFQAISDNYLQHFISGSIDFFTDFDVIENIQEIESIPVEWSDGTQKIIQTTHAKTLEMLMYFTSVDRVDFLGKLKANNSITINGSAVTFYTYETGQIGYDYYYVIIRGNIDTIKTNFDLSPNNTYNLRVVSDATYNYYTDFAPEFIDESPEINTSNNNAGVNVATKNISKQVKRLTFFENQSDAFTLKQKYELGGTVTIDTVPILETRQAVVTKLGYDIYRIEIDALISANERY